MHRVLCEVAPNQWQIIGDTGTPIELLQCEVGSQHAIGLKDQNMMIVDQDSNVTTKFENYRPLPQPEGEPITPENEAIRDRWLKSIIAFSVPRDLMESYDQEAIREALIAAKIEVSIRPDGCAAIIYRDGVVLATWDC